MRGPSLFLVLDSSLSSLILRYHLDASAILWFQGTRYNSKSGIEEKLPRLDLRSPGVGELNWGAFGGISPVWSVN